MSSFRATLFFGFFMLSQILTIQNKEKEAKENAKRREKELQMQRKQQQKAGLKPGFAGGFGSDSAGPSSMSSTSPTSSAPAPMSMSSSSMSMPAASSSSSGDSSLASKKCGARCISDCRPGRGMKLGGGKAKTADFVEALIAEGDLPAPREQAASSSSSVCASALPLYFPRAAKLHR